MNYSARCYSFMIRSTTEEAMCQHQPRCPESRAPDHLAARIIAGHPEQGWSMLCNGVIVFDDGGKLLPGSNTMSPEQLAPSDPPVLAA